MAILSKRSSGSFENKRDVYVPMPVIMKSPRSSCHQPQSLGTNGGAPVESSWRYLFVFTTQKHVVETTIALVSTLASALFRPAAAICFGKIFSILTTFGAGTATAQDTLHGVAKWCTALVGLGGIAWIVEGMFLSSWMAFGEAQARNVRLKMFEVMLDKEIEWYDSWQDGIGSLLIRIQTQIRELQLAVSQPLGFLAYEIFGSMASLGLAFYFSWKLTLVIISVFPIAGIILYLISMPLTRAVDAQKQELTKASKYANTAIEAIDTVKAYNGEDQEVWQYYSTIKRVASSYMVQARISALQFGFTKLLMVGIFVQGFWFGLYLVDHGMDPGHVLTTFYACLAAMQSVETVLPQWLVIAKGISAGQTLKSIVDQMEHGRKVTHMIGSTKPTPSPGDIEVNEVSFAYPSSLHRNALNNATFFFPAGETTFVVGKSGSGKSTLGNLLMKYYDPLRGEILIDGHSIQTLDVDWLRQNVTLVQQQSVLFNETVYQNITFGRKGYVTNEDVLNASKTGDLGQTIIDLPEGLETLVGSNGKSLSGGQQQRIAIARARLRDAPIVILDEATSALDRTSRQRVMEEIKKWREKKTTIVITHDVSQIRDNEYVYVLDCGVVVQEGYCKTLAEKECGTFASFLAVQTQENSSRTSIQRRNSEPTSPISASTNNRDEEFGERWKYVSKLFGMHDSSTSSRFKKDTPRNRRASYDAGSAPEHTASNDAIWSTPILPPEIFKPPNPGTFRPNSLSFLTPRPQSVASPQDVSQPPFQVTSAGSAKAGRLRPVPPPVNTFADQPRASLLQTQQNINSPSNITSTPKKPQRIKPASFRKILATIWPTLSWKNRIYFLFGFLFALIVAAATPAFAYVFARLLEIYYLQGNRAAQARIWAFALLAIACADGVATFCMHYALERSGQAWVNSLRVEALKRILAQPRSWFDKEKNSTAKLNECLDRNAEEMRNLVGRFAGPVSTSIWMLGISIVWAFMISWRLSLVAVGCVPVVYGITRLFSHISSKWEEKCNVLSAEASNVFTETFSNIRVVRALTLESHFKQKHSLATTRAYKTGLSRAIYSGILFGLGDSVSFFITATIFYYGTVIIASGSLTVSSVLEVVTLLLFGISNSLSTLSIIPQLSSSRTTATHMLKLSRLPLRSEENLGTQRLATPFPIHFNNLNFTYPSRPHQRTLSSITLTIEPGTLTALVGPSGSGKSTLSSLILALYPPDALPPHHPHPLTFAGIPISQCNIASLRSHIAIVPQSPILFPTTILENIIYGLPEGSPFASLEAAVLAAKDAGIHGFISSLPNSYNTAVGEGGQGLSGGQAQSIAIARALIRRPKVLILDEATSALDAVSAEMVRETVRRLMERGREGGEGGMAVLIIAHGVEMMRICERIVVLESGMIVEAGSFEELKRRGGAFCRLIGGSPGAGGVVVEQERAWSPIERRNRMTWLRKGSI